MILVLVVNKRFLLEQIQQFRPSEIKIEGKVTKLELIRGIFEQQESEQTKLGRVKATFEPAKKSGLGVVGDVAGIADNIGKLFTRSNTKDMMELDEESREGISDIRRDTSDTRKEKPTKEIEEKKSNQSIDKKPKSNKDIKEKNSTKEDKKPSREKVSGTQVQKTGLKFATDLGFKAVAINDAFKKMNEPKQIALKSMFSPEEIKRINNSKSKTWNSMTPKKFYCREKNIELGGETDSTVPCWRMSEKDKVRMANQVTKGLLSNYYTRLDENGGEGRFKHPKSGEVWVPMGSRSDDLVFSYLPLSQNKNAVIFKMPNNDEDIFVAPMGTKKLNFLFDTGIEPKTPAPTPKSVSKPKKDKESKSSKERAGELLLGINKND